MAISEIHMSKSRCRTLRSGVELRNNRRIRPGYCERREPSSESRAESLDPRAEQMPPRFTYWTILIDGQPTAFRAHQQADLLPTLVQIRRANPSAEMKWFARGRIWDSPDAAQAETRQRGKGSDVRGPDWRPGGQHKDPRARFTQSRAERRKKFARRQRAKKHTP